MAQVQCVVDGEMQWGSEVMNRMRQVGQELRHDRPSTGTAATAVPADPMSHGRIGTIDHEGKCAPSSNGMLAALVYQTDDGLGVSGHDDNDDDDDKVKDVIVDSEVLKVRQEKQMVPECIRMLKALLVSGSKAD
jgi:hypothetical protein